MLLTHTPNPHTPLPTKPLSRWQQLLCVPVCSHPHLCQHTCVLPGVCFQSESSLTIGCKCENKPQKTMVELSQLLQADVVNQGLSSACLSVPGILLRVFWTLNPTCRVQHLFTCIYQQSPSGYFFPQIPLVTKMYIPLQFSLLYFFPPLFNLSIFLNLRFSFSSKIATMGLQPHITHSLCYGFNFPLRFLEKMISLMFHFHVA